MRNTFFTCMIGALILSSGNISIAQHDHSPVRRIPSKGMAAKDAKAVFVPYEFDRHPVGDNDILIEILYCGICHSDIHSTKGHWHEPHYPIVPGHEIAGRVAQIGKNVSKFKVGDLAGVGCMVNSCGTCEHCRKGEEQFCDNLKTVYTYDSPDSFHDNETTMGGYSNNIVVSEKFAIKIPSNAPLEKIAPLLCAGITTYSPLRYSKVKAGDDVAVAGFGGLGHLAVKYAVSFGAKVTVFDITEEKRNLAMEMGAVKYINVKNSDELKGMENLFNMILSTIPYEYDINIYLPMLKTDGEFVMVGMPPIGQFPTINTELLFNRRKAYVSLIGGIAETQEMIDYSIERGIYPDVEIIKPDEITEAYKKAEAGQVHFRYVIDMQPLK